MLFRSGRITNDFVYILFFFFAYDTVIIQKKESWGEGDGLGGGWEDNDNEMCKLQ